MSSARRAPCGDRAPPMNDVIAADVGDHEQHFREDGIKAADEVDAGGDHRRRVDERRDGRGPSIASGSHTCSGNWPLLPTQAMNSAIAAQISTVWFVPASPSPTG